MLYVSIISLALMKIQYIDNVRALTVKYETPSLVLHVSFGILQPMRNTVA